MHARIAADALERLVRDVQSGRASWETYPASVAPAVDDLARIATAAAAVLQQLAAAHGRRGGPRAGQGVAALHRAGQDVTTAATHLRTARHTVR
ncbi:hypothetical protein AB0D16_40615 [Streptomyces sp. NPDC048161]|uniref:hypothetical protein n=1 Tax=Streptomyces sp. NPDC048161 TaxID=3160985 RepID=UPI0033CB32E4